MGKKNASCVDSVRGEIADELMILGIVDIDAERDLHERAITTLMAGNLLRRMKKQYNGMRKDLLSDFLRAYPDMAPAVKPLPRDVTEITRRR
jgi:hypothetical protein